MANRREIGADKWEQAYLRQSHDVAVGRLFRGTVHNPSGALLVFSLQTDLLVMTIGQAEAIMRQLLAAELAPDAKALARQLFDLLPRRAEAVRQMRDKVRSCEQIVQRTLFLPDFASVMGADFRSFLHHPERPSRPGTPSGPEPGRGRTAGFPGVRGRCRRRLVPSDPARGMIR